MSPAVLVIRKPAPKTKRPECPWRRKVVAALDDFAAHYSRDDSGALCAIEASKRFSGLPLSERAQHRSVADALFCKAEGKGT